MTKREKIYAKYGGKCAYTGKPLGDDWQVDHMLSISDIYYKVHGNIVKSGLNPKMYEKELRQAVKEKANSDSNLLPALRIVNHYKRSLNLEQFRQRMADFHLRLAILPEKTKVPATVKRIRYMNEVAEAFGITPDKPFDGKFYFEKLEEKNMSFLHSCFIENSPEAREWLESIGYEKLADSDCQKYIITIRNHYMIVDNPFTPPIVEDCRGNMLLFKAITAMRDDGLEYMVWYINNHTGQWKQCDFYMMEDDSVDWDDWTEASLEELINHFKK